MSPTPNPTLPAYPEGKINKIITTTASQVPELLCQSMDWINWKFYEVCGHLKRFIPVRFQYALSQCQCVPPYIRFEGAVELCSRLWLVVAVRQRDKRKGSINSSQLILFLWVYEFSLPFLFSRESSRSKSKLCSLAIQWTRPIFSNQACSKQHLRSI